MDILDLVGTVLIFLIYYSMFIIFQLMFLSFNGKIPPIISFVLSLVLAFDHYHGLLVAAGLLIACNVPTVITIIMYARYRRKHKSLNSSQEQDKHEIEPELQSPPTNHN
jgi:hypothetical protein